MSEARAERSDLRLFVAVIGLSAFLLFTLELLVGRLVLPVFGGAPAVWTTALCFFTALVFFGYLYAHLVAVRLSPRAGGALHLLVAGLVVATVALMPTDLASLRFAGIPAVVNVLFVLAVIAGAPAFLLSTTTPLLSAWYSGRGEDAWWLYAVSNGASLAGLLAYPFLVEATIPLSGQRALVKVLLALLVVGLALVARGSWRPPAMDPPTAAPERAAPDTASPALTGRRQVLWLLAACAPAGLLSATTTHLTTDLFSTPLIWVGPLGIYLGSFVVAFSERGRRVLPFVDRLVPAAATLMWVIYVLRSARWPTRVLLPLLLALFGVIAVAVHGRLALDRPAGEHLTRFYLIVSAGGMLATAFVALLAPVVFDDVYEYPILLVAGIVAWAWLPDMEPEPTGLRANVRAAVLRLAPYAILAAVLVPAAASISRDTAGAVGTLLGFGAFIIVLGRTPKLMAVGTAVTIPILLYLLAPADLAKVRTFFGVTTVRETHGGAAHSEFHGTTLHGVQFQDGRRGEPVSYYVPSGPLGDVTRDLRERSPGGAVVGNVGLGVGTLAAFARPGDSLTFFEIDQAVVDLARDARYFTYLADAPVPARIVLGDGRLSLDRQPPGTFDLLTLDAFSSDAIPAHLLTREAFRSYARVMRPGGIIAVHLSNHYFDLVPAVASTARSVGLEAKARDFRPGPAEQDRLAAVPSRWLVVGQAEDVARFDRPSWYEPPQGRVLTDDFSDVLWLLRSN